MKNTVKKVVSFCLKISGSPRFARDDVSIVIARNEVTWQSRKWMPSICFGIAFQFMVAPSHADNITSHPPKQKWSFAGTFGTFKRDELQRGFQVYKEVCSACHSLKRIRFRNLKSLGFNEAEIKAIAAGYEVKDGPNAEGEMFQRKAVSIDAIPSPYPNDNAARTANNGALPPDLSLIIKAREGGADYVHALMNGYTAPPAGVVVEGGRHYNQYFPGGQISMAKPLTDGQVTYADGTKATVEQMSRDVATFLAWAAEPEAEQRKQMGVKVMAYLLVMTVIFYLTMRCIWRDVK